MINLLKILTVSFSLTGYTLPGTVTALPDYDTIEITDTVTGNVWTTYGEGLSLGDNVLLFMDTNGTPQITDDLINDFTTID